MLKSAVGGSSRTEPPDATQMTRRHKHLINSCLTPLRRLTTLCGCPKFIKWHTILNLEQSVVDDVQRIRAHPLVPKSIPIYGYIYDVKTGRLIEVPVATAASKVGHA